MTGDYERIEAAIHFLSENVQSQPGLEETAAAAGLSPFHFQRLFRRWAGVSPKRFLKYLTLEHAKARLAESASVMDTALDLGLSGPARLHDHFVTLEAVTPGEFKRGGSGVKIVYGLSDSPFGHCLIASTDRGVCGLGFVGDRGLGKEVARLEKSWPGASISRDDKKAGQTTSRIFAGQTGEGSPVRLHVAGTNFQIQVWRALLTIPAGGVATYGQIAAGAGRPAAARAAGTAIGANPVAWLIPCHRVIRASGVTGGYRWGPDRKRAMLGWEAACTAVDSRESGAAMPGP